ncbi:MAG TPA: hypothetical protein VKZ53_23270 [Candidatus Angelobacter sp.]|nr:hypothetical protein [Candidatus Angelobacter sp.]
MGISGIFYYILYAPPLINVFFLFTILLQAINLTNRSYLVLRAALCVLFFAPLAVFYKLHVDPTFGYFMWMSAMLIVLFHKQLASLNWTAPQEKTIAG